MCYTSKKTKVNYYGNLNEKEITDNKKFWKTVKPFLYDKSKAIDKKGEKGNYLIVSLKQLRY